jgi:hypothetical protein
MISLGILLLLNFHDLLKAAHIKKKNNELGNIKYKFHESRFIQINMERYLEHLLKLLIIDYLYYIDL